MTTDPVIIVGAGQAGVSAALALRQTGFSAPIRLYSDETEWPYDRPPLSKSFASDGSISSIPILSEADALTNSIDMIRGVSVVSIDAENRQIALSNGMQDIFGALILATGGSARTLPTLAADNSRVFSLRTLADAHAISRSLAGARNVAVIGGGWLGLEIAAALSLVAKTVAVFEAAAHVCQRSLPKDVGAYLQHMHEERGVRIHTSAKAAFEQESARIIARHNDGRTDSFDIAIVATGLMPRMELAATAGIACNDGILTDGAGRTSKAGIYAIGDVARLHHDGMQQRLRLESWTNATTQGLLVAQAICGQQPRYTSAPWFWSEQFDRIVQVAGLPQPDLELLSVEDGDNPLWHYGKRGKLMAVIGIDRPKDVRAASRRLTAQLEDKADTRASNIHSDVPI